MESMKGSDGLGEHHNALSVHSAYSILFAEADRRV
jgi:hypothetical protein